MTACQSFCYDYFKLSCDHVLFIVCLLPYVELTAHLQAAESFVREKISPERIIRSGLTATHCLTRIYEAAVAAGVTAAAGACVGGTCDGGTGVGGA